MTEEPVFVVAVALNAVLSGYALWQVRLGWRAKRRDEPSEPLVMAGAARLLLAAALWIAIFLYTPSSHHFGPLAGIVAFVACVLLLALAVLVDSRRRRLTRTSRR